MKNEKQINVTFEYDQGTKIISNLKCFVNGIEKEKVEQPVNADFTSLIGVEKIK